MTQYQRDRVVDLCGTAAALLAFAGFLWLGLGIA
jgi:hypothetical protein